jgi:hypothetical protein
VPGWVFVPGLGLPVQGAYICRTHGCAGGRGSAEKYAISMGFRGPNHSRLRRIDKRSIGRPPPQLRRVSQDHSPQRRHNAQPPSRPLAGAPALEEVSMPWRLPQPRLAGCVHPACPSHGHQWSTAVTHVTCPPIPASPHHRSQDLDHRPTFQAGARKT